MQRGISLCCLALALAFFSPAGHTQSASPAAAPDAAIPPLPKKPEEIMQLAERVNGVASPDMKPWHVKTTFQTFNYEGQPKEQWTFEEWWAGPNRYKVSFISPSFTQTEYVTNDARYLIGAQTDPPLIDSL